MGGSIWSAAALAAAAVWLAGGAAAETRDHADADPARPPSVSCGATNRGALSDAAELPLAGTGYLVPSPWRERGTRYGTTELIGLIERAAAEVRREHPGATLGVGDLSTEDGGAIGGHRSHQSGRDADLIYYALDEHGLPFYPDQHMAYYTPLGHATYAQAPAFVKDIPVRFFDAARNWSLVRALIRDPQVDVQRIFVSHRVRRWLLRYAAELGEPEELIRAARRLLHAGARGHNDHLHLRIACSADDVALGRCQDGTARRPRRARRWHTRVPCPRPVRAPALP